MRRPVLTICVALGVLFLIGLGAWQVARLQWKENLIERTERLVNQEEIDLLAAVGADIRLNQPTGAAVRSDALEEYTPVSAVGGFPTAEVIHVSGTFGGRPGFYVFQPFLPDDSTIKVLVNRGFVASDARRDTYRLPDAERLTGLFRQFENVRLFAPPPDRASGTAYDRSFQTLVGQFHETGPETAVFETGFAPFYLDSTLPTELPRGGTTRLDFSNRHLGYAITWFGLAAGLIAVYVAMMRRR